MKVRRIQLDKDYPILKTWWERRGSEAPHLALLPPMGVVAELDGLPIACAFLYEIRGVALAIVEWEATNPEIKSPILKVKALNTVFDFWEDYCREVGIKIVLSWTAEDRGDGRLLRGRKWTPCPGERHELMAFDCGKELVCQR